MGLFLEPSYKLINFILPVIYLFQLQHAGNNDRQLLHDWQHAQSVQDVPG